MKMEDDTEYLQNRMTGEEIVVTGMSGKFPNSESVKEFMENLYNKVDMVSVDPNWEFNDPEVPKHTGKVKGMEKFDAQFFKVGYKQAAVLEPMSKKLLEHAYGALFDSGNTHATLQGKIIGVFIGSAYSDFSTTSFYDITKTSDFKVGGTSKSMFANRISYWVDGKGPSYCVDYSCASSTAALEQAYSRMRAGECDAAVVGGCNLCSLPLLSLNMKRAGLLCSDGKTKCFDKNGDGYVRSDAISLIFLQKAKDAKRVYAELCHVQGSYQLQYNDSFLPIRKSEDLQSFFDDVYSNVDVDPKNVEYVEANGSGLAEADENEAKAIANTFTRHKGVKIGSVKSNMGHSEAASGLCALTKLCLAYHKGEIPANLHCEKPVQPITDGKVQVLTENTKFQRGYSALNNLSLTGAGFHVVLKGHFKEKKLEKYNSEIPRIVLASGRQESCVKFILDDLKSKKVDAEEIALLHNIFQFDIVGHTGRGYTILDTIEGNTVAVSENIDYYKGVRPPLWFVYSGMGSQWAGMGADLMRIPIFAAAIERCDKVLSPKGIDIVKVLTDLDKTIFDNSIHAFVGITAVQMGLTDILKEMGVVPDYIIEITRLIPDNAVIVEIAPHGLLQAILKRSHPNCTHIPLTRRGQQDGVKFLLDAVGKLYLAGYNPKVDVLYPKVEFPVSTETPLLSHLVEWEHSEDWQVSVSNKISKRINAISRNFVLSVYDDDYKYLEGHIRNGVNVLPEAAFLIFVWETLAMYKGKDFRGMSVIFKDIQFHREVTFIAKTPIKIAVQISKGNDAFVVTQDDKLIVSGIINQVKSLKFHDTIDNYLEDKTDAKLTSQDIYKELKMRGFDYKGSFRSILKANLNRNNALLKWTDNWILFLDSLIQFHTFSRDVNGMSKPKFIGRLSISILEHENVNHEIFNGINCYDANINNIYGVLRCAGVKMENVTYTDTLLSDENMAKVFESRIFFPFYSTEEVDTKLALKMSMQIITENSSSKNILFTKVVGDEFPKELEFIDEVADHAFMVNTKIRMVKNDIDEIFSASETYKSNETNVIVIENILKYSKKMINFNTKIGEETFIISFEDTVPEIHHPLRDVFNILSSMRISHGNKNLVLMKTLCQDKNMQNTYISISHNDAFTWVPDVLNQIEKTKKRIVLISDKQLNCGILGFVQKLKANGYQNISAVIIDDSNAPKFDFTNDLYKNQLQKLMTINILKQSQWGNYYSIISKNTPQNHFALKNVSENFDRLSWVEIPKENKASVQVYYSGLSTKNCLKNISRDTSIEIRVKSEFGMDFSGIDKNGLKIMGLTYEESVATSVEIDHDLIWPVPNHWTLEDAATVPLAYVQAYYCLMVRGQLESGKSVLILDGSSNVGLALISLCISFDCIIFTVVDSKDKKHTLLNLFSELNESQIICLADDFYSSLMTLTKGQGCEYVINFAAGPIRENALQCVAVSGCLLDFSKQDFFENKTIGMSFLYLMKSYITVDIVNIFKPEFSRDREILQKYIAEGIKSGVVKPLTRVVFSPLQVNEALKMVSLNKHTGKVLVKVKDPTFSRNGLEIIPRILFSSQDVLIIVCDERGVAIEVTDKLIARGARKIILHLQGSVSGYLHTKLLTWSKQEVSIKLSSDNLQTENGCETLMRDAMKFGKLKGIFVVLDPKQTDNRTKEGFINAFKQQSLIVMNLDKASKNSIDPSQFVVISRFTQSTSDEYALSLIEKVCDNRNEMGLPMLVVRYGSLNELDDSVSKIGKMKPQTVSELFNAIETGLKLKLKNVITCRLSNKDDKCRNITSYNENGMYTFYKYLDTEEDNIASQRLVELNILLSNSSNTDMDDSYIILIPGFEGRPQIFESMAERLKMKAIAVKLAPDLEIENIKTIALNAREELKRRHLETKKKFYILGYSFGVNIALELAAIFEKEGNTGIVHCIDSSPDAMQVILQTTLGEVSEDQLQNHVLNHMCKLTTRENNFDIESDLMKLDSYEVKVEECLKRMKGIVNYSIQYKKHVIESAYKRIIIAREYKPEIKLKSEIVLMKSSVHHNEDQLAYDYGLSKYTEKPVKVFNLEADHATAPLNVRVPNIVNQFVDKDILKKFNEMNLCDVYLI